MNDQLDGDNEDETEEDSEDEKTLKELQKEAKKDARLQKRLEKLENLLQQKMEKWDAWEEKHNGERIVTEDADLLKVLVERVIEKLVE